MSHLFNTYARADLVLVDGHDAYVTDDTGNDYLDFGAGIGVMNLGYHHPVIQEAVEQQLKGIWHTSNLYESPLQEKVAHLLTQENDQLVFFANSGAEANEAALKLARRYTGKHKIMNFSQAFHGRTYGALSLTPVTAYQEGYGVDQDVVTLPFNQALAIEALDGTFAAVILEVVQGEGGIHVAQKEWLHELVAKANELGVLVIIDEVQSGMGRTGSLYAYQQFGITPDIVTVAKALANGLPVGAMIGRSDLGRAFQPGAHGTTFGGNPIVMASAIAVLETLTPEFLATVAHKGELIRHEIEELSANLPQVKMVRGAGLMIGIELNVDVNAVLVKLREKRILALSAQGNTLRLLPVLTMDQATLHAGIVTILETIGEF
ncbi:acetylornithine transaminase [Weissella confusa]|uniref:Aminotransferase class III-fold pyridoxal phosphate-dependent enzyme n=2 Tax=Weissella confusa TaxID=1583 RepID=A0AAJ2YYS4_WEICO|nr:acetylornithine transaminase [Weissella confusa]MBJ7693614.1 aminotransferase class III-fold pyridoxal phosphate-dependent enzyme [Weissella confusa]NBA10805.1 aminotransferase class III-fold pyridoxal phosphate-dependent enzyme [Weissella confusa]QBZ03715.1 acetylornithine transaminase [Weissella confusa]